MFTSVPYLILLLSIVFFIQAVFFYFYELSQNGTTPILVSLFFSVLYLSVFFSVRKRGGDSRFLMLTFIILLSFFLCELLIITGFNIRYIWVLLVFAQLLGGYYLLSNKYYYPMLTVLTVIYLFYTVIHLYNNFNIELILAISSAYLFSFLIHKDRRQALLKLEDIYNSQREINNRFEQLEENIGQIFILCSSDFTEYFYISSAFERMLTLSRDELMEKPSMWIDFIHPGDKERILFELKTAASDKTYHEFDLRLIQSENPMWLKFQIFPIDSKKGNGIDRFAIIIGNITENKNAELKLAEAKSLDAEFAARIQKNLLFSDPDLGIGGLDISAESLPSLDVGGDFFDFYRYSDSIVDIIIADVMGKGMIASMLGAASKSAFMKSRLDLTVLDNDIPAIKKIMTITNQSLSPELINLGKFITMQYARLDLDNALFSFIDSGHTSILYYSARHKSSWSLKGWNMPIGFNPEEEMINSIIPFSSKDLFFFYSDGVTEAENEEMEQFGEKRLNYVINSSAHLTSSQILNKVKNLVFHYSSSEGFADDMTCIAMKIGDIEDNEILVEGIFPGTRKTLQVIRTFTSGFLRTHFPSIDEEQKNSIILAVNEAVANIIEHNYEQDPQLDGREILIEAGMNGNACFFRLYYDGQDFDWSTVRAPDLSEMKSGGYGLLLMKEIMDSICYSKNIDGVQCLSLLKFL